METKRSDTRLKILHSALQLMVAKGAGGVTMNDVARDAGTSKASLYYYFTDKNELIRGLLDLGSNRLIGDLEMASARSVNSEQALQNMGHVFLTDVKENRQFSRFLVNEIGNVHQVWHADMKRAYDSIVDLLEVQLQRGIREGAIRADLNTNYAAHSIISLFLSVPMHPDGTERDDLEEYIEHVKMFIENGISAASLRTES